MANENRISKSDLIDQVALATESTKVLTKYWITAVLSAITENLEKGSDVALSEFGIFKVRNRAARKGRNPQTGDTIDIPATTAVTFKQSKKG